MTMSDEEYLRLRKGLKAEEGHSPPDDVAVSELLMKLAAWASEPHDVICEGIHCRHERAREAAVEVNNAVAACQRDHEESERRLAEGMKPETGGK